MGDKKRSHRRDFLKGKSAVGAIRATVGVPADSVAGPGKADLHRQAAYLEQYSKNAMACEFEFLFNLHQYAQSGAAAAAGFQLMRFDRRPADRLSRPQ